ncbi:hypothetical protein, partial [Caballeronia calidae]|uniref:hypothetical protein n=1 Tax=Caballeronia calidae TaxID=1777139 RepID=UPI0012FE619A
MKFPLFGVSPVLLLDTGNLSHSGHQNNANVGPPRRNQHFKDLGDLRLNTDGVKSDDTVKKIKLSLSAPSQSSPAQNAKRKARDVLNGLLPCDDHGRIAPGTLVPGSLTYSLWACAVLVTNFTSTNLDPLDPSSHAPDQAGVSAGCVPVLPRALDSWLTNDGRREANSKIANELLNWRNYIACEVNVSTLKSALNAPELPVECQERKDLSAALATQQKELSKLQDKFSRSTGINSIANQKLTGWIRDVIGNSLSSANFIPSAVLSQARINGNYSTANLMNAAPGLEILGQIVAGTGLSLSVLSGITNALQGIGEIRDQYTRLDQLTEWKNREKQALFSLISRCSDSDGVAQASVPVAREVAALREQYRQFGSRDRKLLHEAGTSRVLQALCTNGTSMAAGGIQLGAAIAGASAALAPVTMGLTIASAILSAVYLAAVTWRIERQKRARKEFTKWQGKLKANICDIDGQPGELYTRIKTQIKVSKPFRQYLQAIGVPSELVEEIQKAPEQREGELANRLIAALLREPRSDADDKAVIRNTWEDADASTRWHIYAFWKAKGWPLAEIRMKTDSSGSDKPWIRKLAKGADAADIWKANIDAKEFATWWSYKDPKKKEDPQKKEDSEKEEEDFRTFAVRSVQTSAKTLFAMVPSLETDLLPVSPSSDQVFKAIGQLKQLWEKYGAIRAKV